MDYDDEYYENLLNKVPNYEATNKALEITKEFILSKGLIMTGGMAIDMALRLKGNRLYSDSKQVDYDLYSTDNINDAYELGSILCKHEYKNVSCINAIHLKTMAVRVDFINIADFTYCPSEVLKRIPILVYNKFKIVHPHWQMIDQHSALSFPYTNPGREVIFQRWSKDMTRYDLLYKHYPVIPTRRDGKAKERRTISREKAAKKLLLSITTVHIDISMLDNSIISGWGSASYIIKGDTVTIRLPKGEPLSLASHDYSSYITKNNLRIKSLHCEYVGKLPQYIRCYSDIKDEDGDVIDIEIFDVYGLLISAEKINEEHNLWVCCIQWSMLYLMVKIFSSDDKKIIFTAEEWYAECRQIVADGKCPSPVVCGTYNYSRDFIYALNKSKAFLYSIPMENKRPNNRYPVLPLCEITDKYDPSIIKIDGSRVSALIDYNVDPYPGFTTSTVKHVGE